MYGLSLHILDLIEHFIQARVSAISVAVECDRPNEVLKILLKDISPIFADVSDKTKSRSPKNPGRDIDLERLRDTAAGAGDIFMIGRGELGETTVAGTVKLNSIKGEIYRDLAVMLSSIVGDPSVFQQNPCCVGSGAPKSTIEPLPVTVVASIFVTA